MPPGRRRQQHVHVEHDLMSSFFALCLSAHSYAIWNDDEVGYFWDKRERHTYIRNSVEPDGDKNHHGGWNHFVTSQCFGYVIPWIVYSFNNLKTCIPCIYKYNKDFQNVYRRTHNNVIFVIFLWTIFLVSEIEKVDFDSEKFNLITTNLLKKLWIIM